MRALAFDEELLHAASLIKRIGYFEDFEVTAGIGDPVVICATGQDATCGNTLGV